MVFLIILGIVIAASLIYLWIKAVRAVFDPILRKMERKQRRLSKNDNPYIIAHRTKMHNDEMYQEYLKWLDKQGGDIPFEKWKTAEEKEFDQKVNL